MMREIEGFILAGGASTRMGRDKAGIEFDGETLARRAFCVLAEFADSVHVVGGNVQGLASLGDVFPSHGGGTRASLIGLHSALFHAGTDWIAVLACDLPFVTAAFFRRLIGIADSEGGGVDAVVPLQPDGRPQPLAALYRRTHCLAAANEMLIENNFRLSEFLTRVSTREVDREIYGDLDNADRFFLNVNTPGDLDAALAALAG